MKFLNIFQHFFYKVNNFLFTQRINYENFQAYFLSFLLQNLYNQDRLILNRGIINVIFLAFEDLILFKYLDKLLFISYILILDNFISLNLVHVVINTQILTIFIQHLAEQKLTAYFNWLNIGENLNMKIEIKILVLINQLLD